MNEKCYFDSAKIQYVQILIRVKNNYFINYLKVNFSDVGTKNIKIHHHVIYYNSYKIKFVFIKPK
jgi:hypothetical protein